MAFDGMDQARLAARLAQVGNEKHALQAEKESLEEMLEEQQDSLARVSERLAQSKEDIRKLELELSIERDNRSGKEKIQKDISEGKGEGSLNSKEVTLSDAVNVLREQLDDVSELLDVPIPHRRGRRQPNAVQPESIPYVTVEFDNKYCAFRLTPTYTFDQLTYDACRYWNIELGSATLKDAKEGDWPRQAAVCEVLADVITMQRISQDTVQFPKVRLVRKNITDEMDGVVPLPSKSETKGAITDRMEEAAFLRELLLESDRKRKENKSASKTADRARRARIKVAKSLSAVFHEPHEQPYSNRTQHFRPAEGFEQNSPITREKSNNKFLSICMKFMCWGFFISLLIASMTFRYMTTSMYSTTVSYQDRFLAPFKAAKPLLLVNDTFRWLYSIQTNTMISGVPRQYPFAQNLDTYNFLRERIGPSIFMSENNIAGISLANGEQRLIGPMIIRQNRVGNRTCEPSSLANVLTDRTICYGIYSSSSSSKVNYGPATGTEPNSCEGTKDTCASIGHCAFVYSKNNADGLSTVGYFATYPADAFVVKVPRNASSELFECIVNYLEDNEWLDRSSRVVFISFVMFNSNMNLVVGTEIRIEFNPSGDVYTEIYYDRLTLSLYESSISDSAHSAFLIVADVFCFLASTLLLYLLVVDIIVFGTIRTLSTVWNIVVLVAICSNISAIAVRVAFTVRMNRILDTTSQLSYTKLQTEFQLYEASLWLDVVTLVAGMILLFKFTQSNRKISGIFETMYRSSRMAAALIFILLVVLFASLFAAFLVYGPTLAGWRTFQSSFSQLLGFIYGEIEIALYRQESMVYSLIFFGFFLVYFSFISMAFITAIYVDAYFEVSAVGIPKAPPKNFWGRVFCSPILTCRRRWHRGRKVSQNGE